MPRYTVEKLKELIESREYIIRLSIRDKIMLKDGQKLFDILKLFQDLKDLHFDENTINEDIDLTVFPKLERISISGYYCCQIIFASSLKKICLRHANINMNLSMCSELQVLDLGEQFIREKIDMSNFKKLEYLIIRYGGETKLEISELENLNDLTLISECQTKKDFEGLKKLEYCDVITYAEFKRNEQDDEWMNDPDVEKYLESF